ALWTRGARAESSRAPWCHPMMWLSAVQRADNWRAELPVRLGQAAAFLRFARLRGEIREGALYEVLEVAEATLDVLSREALEPRTVGALYQWIDWAQRVFRITEYALSFCVDSRASSRPSVLWGLGAQARALERLAAQAQELNQALVSTTM